MDPSELKKLRNKQRRARKKAELEKEKQTAAAEKREQHNKSRQQQDGESDGPKEEELIPEKLARVEDPMSCAVRFLRPIQTLAADRIDTHLIAFEIYIRKRKLLLMLQSVKRAFALAPNHPGVHSCLVRFYKEVSEAKGLPDAVTAVLNKEMSKIYKGKDAVELNQDFLLSNSKSLPHLLEGSRMLYLLDPSKQEHAIELISSLSDDFIGVNAQVCTKVLQAVRNGDLGPCDAETEEYRAKCQQIFPYTVAFKPTCSISPPSTSPQPLHQPNTNTNHVDGVPWSGFPNNDDQH